MNWVSVEDSDSDKNHFVYYENGDVRYQVHSADRMIGENTGKWVCCYYSIDSFPPSDELEGYIGIKNGKIVFCGGNASFNAIGVPKIAKFATDREAMDACELHNGAPGDSRRYTFEENRQDCLRDKKVDV